MINPFRSLSSLNLSASTTIYPSTKSRKAPERRKGFFNRLINLGEVLETAAAHPPTELDAVAQTEPEDTELEDAEPKDAKSGDAGPKNTEPGDAEPKDKIAANPLQAGHLALQQGDLDTAITCYRQAIQLDPDSEESYQYLAEALTKQGDLEAAAHCYRQAIALSQAGQETAQDDSKQATAQTTQLAAAEPEPADNPDEHSHTLAAATQKPSPAPEIPWFEQASFHLQQAVVNSHTGDWEEANLSCRLALERLESEAATAYLVLGRSLQEQQQFADAEQAYQKALLIQPNAETYARLASLHVTQRQFEAAITHYREAIRLHPQFAGAYWKLAEVLQQTGQPEQAAECWYQALQIEPSWATPQDYLKLGNTLLQQAKYAPAIECYRRAVERDASLAEAYFYAGEAFGHLGQWQETIQCYQQAIAQNPQNGAFYSALAQVLTELERWQDAIPCYQRLTELKFYQTQGYIGLRTAYIKLEQWQEALFYSQKLIDAQPAAWQSYHELGDIHSRLQQWEQAVAAYQQSIALNPTFSWSHNNLGDALIQLEQWAEAAAAFEQAIQHNPTFPWSHFNLGEVLMRLQQWDRAIAAYRQALHLQSDLPYVRQKLADALYLRSKADRAAALEAYLHCIHSNPSDAKLYRKLLEIVPNHPGLCLQLANVLVQNNELDEAIALALPSLQEQLKRTELNYNAEANAALNPGAQTRTLPELTSTAAQLLEQLSASQHAPGWQFHQTLGDQLQLRGKLPEAVVSYHNAIACNFSNACSHHSLGDAQLKLGEWQKAILSYQRAIALDPDYFWSHYNLGVAYSNLEQWQEATAAYHHSLERNPGFALPIHAIREVLFKQWNALFAEANLLLRDDNRIGASTLYREAIRIYQTNLPNYRHRIPRPAFDQPNVLMVVNDHLPQCFHYRVQQKLEQFEQIGFSVKAFPNREIAQARYYLHFCHVVIFYRVPATPEIIETIQYAKGIQKVVFYEIDDLIFDQQVYPDPIESYGGLVSEEQYQGLIRGTTLFREAMALCDYAIASTPSLALEMAKVVQKRSFLHRNALDQLSSRAVSLATPKIKRDYLSIFYGSGTKAHDADFNELAAPAIARILQKYPQVRLTLVGYVALSQVLSPYSDRIDRIEPISDVELYWEFLRQADINIAVLKLSLTTHCKSEIKWLEAACFKIPSVVSATQTYVELLQPGVDVLFANTVEDWFTQLESLVTQPQLRESIAEAAYKRAWQEYNVPVMAENLKQIILAGIEDAIQTKTLVLQSQPKQKLLIVNVFYPPQSVGGGTRIVKDNVDVLVAQYRDKYDISVFTTDNNNSTPYIIQEYAHENVHVTKVSTPIVAGMDWRYQDAKMYALFTEYLDFNQPDLIHFHCVQRLTGSVVEAAADRKIPYLVTVHDAWWISDHQFLVNHDGVECDNQQNDPVVVAQDSQNLQESLRRRRYLKQCLDRAEAVLAVSENFAAFYRDNGLTQIQTNRNGIMPRPVLPRQPSASGRVRLAHIGGISAHKGYYLFKQAIETAQPVNCEVIVIDHALTVGAVRYEKWGNVAVTCIPRVAQEKMHEFYSTIDVLVAPSTWRESFGLVTREAAAAKVWVIASNKGALAEDILPGINGDVFSPDQPDALVAILQRIDQNPQFYQKAVTASVPVRTTREQVEALEAIYQSILLPQPVSHSA